MAFNAFLQIEGIKGESQDEGHKDWIEVLEYQYGVSQQALGQTSAGGGRGAGRADFKEFTIFKMLDKASPDLALHCANGKIIPKVTLELNMAAGQSHNQAKVVLTNVMVTSVHVTGSPKGDTPRPQEVVSFHYGKIVWSYTPVSNKGDKGAEVKQGWNLENNKQDSA
jgi:type VI secretion system secreted protein Hcp